MLKLRHSFFYSIKSFVEQRNTLLFRACYLLELLIFAYFTARIALLTLILWTQNTPTFSQYDYLSFFFLTQANSRLYNEAFLLQFACMATFNLICRHGLYRKSSFVLGKFYIYVVLNTESYLRNKLSRGEMTSLRRQYMQKSASRNFQNYRLFLANSIFSLLSRAYLKVKSAVHIFFSCEDAHLARMEAELLPVYFSVSFELRVLLIWVVKLINLASFLFQLFVSKFVSPKFILSFIFDFISSKLINN